MSKELKRPIESDYVGSEGYFEYDAWNEAQKKYIDQLESKLKKSQDRAFEVGFDYGKKQTIQAVKDSLMSDEEIDNYEIDGTRISPLGIKALKEQKNQTQKMIRSERANLLRKYSKFILGDNYEAFEVYEDKKINDFLNQNNND